MNKNAVFILASTVMCTYLTASDTTTISIYSDCGSFFADVPITEKVTLAHVKAYLQNIRIACAEVSYTLHPLYNQCWRLGRWNYCSERLTAGKMGDHVKHYDTNTFWIKVKPDKPHQS